MMSIEFFDIVTINDYYGFEKAEEIKRKNPAAYNFLTGGGACCVYRDILDFTPEKEQRLKELVGDEVFEKIKKYDKEENDCWVKVLSTHFNDLDEDEPDDTIYDKMCDEMDKYLKEHDGDGIPLMEIMGNKILSEKFDNNHFAVYAYCNKHGKTWQEVLEANPQHNPNVLY